MPLLRYRSTIRNKTPRGGWRIIALCGIFLCGCGEKDAIIRQKLDIILAGDIKAIVADIPKINLLQSPYDSLVSYKTYTQGMYSKMAVVDFYFLKNVKVKIVRKYRYLSSVRLWDRYYNAYIFFGDTANQASR